MHSGRIRLAASDEAFCRSIHLGVPTARCSLLDVRAHGLDLKERKNFAIAGKKAGIYRAVSCPGNLIKHANCSATGLPAQLALSAYHDPPQQIPFQNLPVSSVYIYEGPAETAASPVPSAVRMMAVMRALVACAAVALSLIHVAAAADYVVGNPDGGWDGRTNYRSWAEAQTFAPGDTLSKWTSSFLQQFIVQHTSTS